jgi:hypothetical protein
MSNEHRIPLRKIKCMTPSSYKQLKKMDNITTGKRVRALRTSFLFTQALNHFKNA